MKCLPRDAMPMANGVTLHDSHAEILALRAFNSFLIQECSLYANDRTSKWVEKLTGLSKPFKIKDDVRIFMYCSEAPCGDASMELTMAEQEDAEPWQRPQAADEITGGEDMRPLRGRGYFSELGIVRTKPCTLNTPTALPESD